MRMGMSPTGGPNNKESRHPDHIKDLHPTGEGHCFALLWFQLAKISPKTKENRPQSISEADFGAVGESRTHTG